MQFIQVYRTFVIWGHNLWISVIPVLLLGLVTGELLHIYDSETGYSTWLRTAMSVWFTWSLSQGSPGSSVLASTAFARSKYFYAATLALNILCTCKHAPYGELFLFLMNCYLPDTQSSSRSGYGTYNVD
jgi:hypothetical protein